MVMLARRSDSGLYTCEAVNQEGFDSASCSVTVTGERQRYFFSWEMCRF